MNQVSDIVQRIVALGTGRSTVLVAVDGCGGAGKTELAGSLVGALEATGQQAHVIHFDDFYLPSPLRWAGAASEKPIGADFDWQRLREQVLVPLRAGQEASYARYDWALDALAETRTVSPGGTIIVEGVYCSRRELAPLYDLRVWVDCPRDLRLRRGIERDGEASRALWELDWMPGEDRYVNQHRPDEMADIVVSGAARLPPGTGPESRLRPMRSSAEAWETAFQRDGHVFPEVFPRFPELAEAFAAHGCRSLLDLGCGTGRHVVALAGRGFRVCGLDLAPTGLRLAARWLQQESLDASLVLADARRPLPFRDSAFDGLLSTQVIHHAKLETIRHTIREMRRVLRPGGLLFVSVLARLEDDIQFEEIEPGTYTPLSGTEEGVPHHVFSPHQFEAELAGFRTIELSRRGPLVLVFMGVKETKPAA